MRNLFSITLIAIFIFGGISLAEPAKVDAVTDEITVSVTVNSGISITSSPDINMSDMDFSGLNVSTGSAVWNVKTNDSSGYTLNVKASTAPAMSNGSNSFLDYTEATPGTPDIWSIESGTVQFGFSGYGDDVENVNSDQYAASAGEATGWGCVDEVGIFINPVLKYLGFETTDQLLATRVGTTSVSGVDTTICFAAEQKGVVADPGTYTATITATALVI